MSAQCTALSTVSLNVAVSAYLNIQSVNFKNYGGGHVKVYSTSLWVCGSVYECTLSLCL